MPSLTSPQFMTVEVASNVLLATSSNYADLLSITINTFPGANVFVAFAVSLTNASTNTANHFQLVIDGVAKRGCATRYVNAPAVCAGIHYTVAALAGGQHVIKVQAKCDSGTLQIRPLQTIDEYASLLVKDF